MSLLLGANIGGSGFKPTCTRIALSPRAETGNVCCAEMPLPFSCSANAPAAACVLGLADGPPVWTVTPSRNGISPRVPENGFQWATSIGINLIRAAARLGSASGNDVTNTSTSADCHFAGRPPTYDFQSWSQRGCSARRRADNDGGGRNPTKDDGPVIGRLPARHLLPNQRTKKARPA
jgi:hypothetical protein